MNGLARIAPQTVCANNHATDDESEIARKLSGRIAAGDLDSEDAAYRRYCDRMRRTARQFTDCHADAENWVSIAWLTALPKLRKGELLNHESLAAFLVSVTRNVAIGELRKCSWLSVSGDSELFENTADTADTSYDAVLLEQRRQHAMDLVDTMPVARDRRLLKRRYFEGCRVSELCNEYKLGRVQVSRLLHRARKRLFERAAACAEPSGLA